MLPLIGMTCATLAGKEGRPPGFRLNQAYARAVAHGGGVPVLIPSLGASDGLRALFDMLHGVLLPGGGDLEPSTYGAERHPKTEEADASLDDTELALARWALAEDKPILGICRGQQCLNVAAGGSLLQDISSEVPGAIEHRCEERARLAHPINIEPDSRLADLLGGNRIPVNSMHHQAVRDVAPGFMVVALADDGVIEGIECPDHPFAVAVQFHPEELVPGHTASERLLQHFVAEAATRADRR
jgi:putative glutamine amidotransferase